MAERRSFLDDIDLKILQELHMNDRIPLGHISEKLNVSLSTIYYRIKRLEHENIIQGYQAKIDLSQHQQSFSIALLIEARIGPDYVTKTRQKLEGIAEIDAIYSLLGNKHFLVLVQTKNQQEYMEKVYNVLANSEFIAQIESFIITEKIAENQELKFFGLGS